MAAGARSARKIVGVSADLLVDEPWANSTDWEGACEGSGGIWQHIVEDDDEAYCNGDTSLDLASSSPNTIWRTSSTCGDQVGDDTGWYGDSTDWADAASDDSGQQGPWSENSGTCSACSHVFDDEACRACLEASVRLRLLEEEWADTHEWNVARDRVSVAFEVWVQLTWSQSHPEDGLHEMPERESPCTVNIAAIPSTCTLEQEIVQAMTPSGGFHQRILQTIARTKVALLASQVNIQQDAMLYGSASLGRRGASSFQSNTAFGDEIPFITIRSDVDVVLSAANNAEANAALEAFKHDSCLTWQIVKSTRVPRFSVAQWTLLNSAGVYLDLTCITDAVEYQRFVQRQQGFQAYFWQQRRDMLRAYGAVGGDVFDAYIYLLKGFASCGSQQILTSFQAMCIGLFVLQRFAQPCNVVPTALALFRHFLLFSTGFFGDGLTTTEFPHLRMEKGVSSASDSIYLCCGASRFAPRQHPTHQAELYLEEVESSFGLARGQWMNVLHNLNSQSIQKAAGIALCDWFDAETPLETWRRIRNDLEHTFSIVLD